MVKITTLFTVVLIRIPEAKCYGDIRPDPERCKLPVGTNDDQMDSAL
jgi:hypothetical protein